MVATFIQGHQVGPYSFFLQGLPPREIYRSVTKLEKKNSNAWYSQITQNSLSIQFIDQMYSFRLFFNIFFSLSYMNSKFQTCSSIMIKISVANLSEAD